MADELRARIRSGVLRPGQRMPTQAQLAAEFGVERQAVRGALRILQSEHLLTNISKGAPATVAERASTGPAAMPQATAVALAPRIKAAFATAHVQIDAVCLTAASLTLAMGESLRQIHMGQLNPDKVDVRVLLPSRDINLAFPVPVGVRQGDENPVHERWLAQRNAQGQVLRHNLHALRATRGIDVRVTFRALPFTPPVKLYLLNGAEALFAYYTVAGGEAELGRTSVPTYEVRGTQSMLFTFEQDTGVRETAFVEQSQLWFDMLWETISSELRLTN